MTGHGDIVNPRAWKQGPLLTGQVESLAAAIDLTWTLPAGVSYFQASGYTIYRSDNGGSFVALATVPLTQLTYTDSTLVSTHSYTYYVTANWADGSQVQSNRRVFAGLITDLFTINGTWTKRQGLKSAIIIAIGGGAGGNSGGTGPSSIDTIGGPGAGAGEYSGTTLAVGALPATAAITVGAGGPGGASVTVAANQLSVINFGTGGGLSSFGSLVTANGGNPQKGTGAPGDGKGGSGGVNSIQQGGGFQSFSSAGVGAFYENGSPPGTDAFAGGPATLAPGGGGGASTYSPFAGGVHKLPAAGGAGQSLAGGAAGGAAGVLGPGTNGTSAPLTFAGGYCGGGGGGGDGVNNIGGKGGDGGLYGGGGGGGCCPFLSQVVPYTTGAGGNGAAGVVVVHNFFW